MVITWRVYKGSSFKVKVHKCFIKICQSTQQKEYSYNFLCSFTYELEKYKKLTEDEHAALVDNRTVVVPGCWGGSCRECPADIHKLLKPL